MTATTTFSDTAVFETAAVLAQAIQDSAAWRALVSAQQAIKEDGRFAQLLARHNELARIQKASQGLDGKLLVEFIASREQIQAHELYVRQQEAWKVAVALLQRINENISQELGFDFASNAAPRRGGCCG